VGGGPTTLKWTSIKAELETYGSGYPAEIWSQACELDIKVEKAIVEIPIKGLETTSLIGSQGVEDARCASRQPVRQ